MPITHSIDCENSLSVTTIEGQITVSEAVDYIKARTAEKGEGEALPVLVDARGADEHDLLLTDMDLLARVAGEIHGRNGSRKEAFVATNEQNAGLLSFFKKFSSNGHNQKIFFDIDHAIGWLKTEG